MIIKKILPIGLAIVGLSLVGCGNNKTAQENGTSSNSAQGTTSQDSPMSNNINGLFGGYGTDGTGYNNSSSPYDTNYNSTNGTQSDRFGYGMSGAENIIGNESGAGTGSATSRSMSNISGDIRTDWNSMKNSLTS